MSSNENGYIPVFILTATISSTSSPSRVTSPMLGYENESGVKYWHLVKPSEMEEKGKGPGNRMMAEVYLPRLLTMKVRENAVRNEHREGMGEGVRGVVVSVN